jgi:hypothetical protein
MTTIEIQLRYGEAVPYGTLAYKGEKSTIIIGGGDPDNPTIIPDPFPSEPAMPDIDDPNIDLPDWLENQSEWYLIDQYREDYLNG